MTGSDMEKRFPIKLVVVTAVVLLAIGALPFVGFLSYQSKVVSTRGVGPRARSVFIDADLSSILWVAEILHTDTGDYPASMEEMIGHTAADGRTRKSSLEVYPLDPWGNPYEYELVNGTPQVRCLGADGAVGGTGEAADIVKVLER